MVSLLQNLNIDDVLKTIRSYPSSIAGKRDHAKEIIIMIVYDDISAAQRAAELFSAVGLEVGGGLKITLQPWRLDLLTASNWEQFAMAEAIQSDMLVIAMSDFSNLSNAVEEWFTTWLHAKRGFHAAVVLLVQGNEQASPRASVGIHILEHAAKEAGLDFFMPSQDYPDQAPQVVSVPPQTFTCRRPYHHWGINE